MESKIVEETCKSFLAARFDLFPEALDLFEIIQERSISKFVQKCIPLIRRITGSSLVDVNMFESIFALSMGEHFNPAYLSNKLSIPQNIITYFVTLLRLAHPKYRNEELKRCINDVPFKTVMENKLKIKTKEFEGVFRLIFSLFEGTSSINEIIKSLGFADKINIELFEGLLSANKPIDPYTTMFKNRVILDDLRT